MNRMTKIAVVAFAAAVAAAPALTAPPEPITTYGPTVTAAQPLRIQPWHLLQQDGAELYAELCASCHGADGSGYGPAASALPLPPPALRHLRQAGVPRSHWRYVIQSGCEDHHHWAPDGAATMPCWQRIFRQALGNDAAALMVSSRLVDHLDSIQE